MLNFYWKISNQIFPWKIRTISFKVDNTRLLKSLSWSAVFEVWLHDHFTDPLLPKVHVDLMNQNTKIKDYKNWTMCMTRASLDWDLFRNDWNLFKETETVCLYGRFSRYLPTLFLRIMWKINILRCPQLGVFNCENISTVSITVNKWVVEITWRWCICARATFKCAQVYFICCYKV